MTASAQVNVEALAASFAGVLRGWLTDAEWAQMRARNAEQEPGESWCASHDHCDANMAMDAAWLMVTERHADPSSDADTALWNEAWDVAKRRYLSGASTHECASCRPPTPPDLMCAGCAHPKSGHAFFFLGGAAPLCVGNDGGDLLVSGCECEGFE